MATIDSSTSLNGTYAQGYEGSYGASATNFTPSQHQSATQPEQQAQASEIPKDEVGWYFVEQYYTTLSKSPEKLHYFYNKRSQYVSGVEEEKVNVCQGQKAINERIKHLDFKDTKVRVTNVDSQGSDTNIVIQVIGEISNQGQPHRRFAQTFVLAEQTNGYFVLNDIFRYLAEDPEEGEALAQEPVAVTNGVQELAPAAAVENAASKDTDEAADSQDHIKQLDTKLQEVAQGDSASSDDAPTASAEVTAEEPVSSADVASVEDDSASKEPEVGDNAEVPTLEKPQEPAPTPATSTNKGATVALPTGPPKPSVPRTWASLAASANKVATPVIPPSTSQPSSAQPKAAAAASQTGSSTAATAPTPASASTSTSTPAAAPTQDQSPLAGQGEATGWQTATGHKKEVSRVQNQVPTPDAEQKRAYIKNVYSQVEDGALRAALSKFGELEYLDISRGKNCAFVDFKTPAGFQAAVAANPHTVNGLEIKVEERRTRPESFRGGFPRGGSTRGRGGPGGPVPRGGFTPRGRGGLPRGGRGAPQEA